MRPVVKLLSPLVDTGAGELHTGCDMALYFKSQSLDHIGASPSTTLWESEEMARPEGLKSKARSPERVRVLVWRARGKIIRSVL